MNVLKNVKSSGSDKYFTREEIEKFAGPIWMRNLILGLEQVVISNHVVLVNIKEEKGSFTIEKDSGLAVTYNQEFIDSDSDLADFFTVFNSSNLLSPNTPTSNLSIILKSIRDSWKEKMIETENVDRLRREAERMIEKGKAIKTDYISICSFMTGLVVEDCVKKSVP